MATVLALETSCDESAAAIVRDGALLASAVAERFDCVLLDLYMPGMSGFDVLAELKLESDPPPVIVVTAHDDADHARRALALDAFECQCKPVGAQRLIDAIERARRR